MNFWDEVLEVGIHGGFWNSAMNMVRSGESTSQQTSMPTRQVRSESEKEVRIPLREEEVQVSTHVEQTGEVRIHKHVITEERQVTVPVSREVVTVERVAVSSSTPVSSENAFEEQAITVPIREG